MSDLRGVLKIVDEQATEIERLLQWVADCQSGMYVNCVYCGHRYGPREDTPAAAVERATELLAEREVEVERLRSLLRDAANEWEDEAKDAREVGFIVNAMHCERKATRLRKAVGGDDDVELHGRT